MFMCFYCNFCFDSDLLRSVHFIREHHFNRDKRSMYCKVCHKYIYFLYSHFDSCHRNYCVNCTEPFENLHDEHVDCYVWFKNGMKHYIYESLFSEK